MARKNSLVFTAIFLLCIIILIEIIILLKGAGGKKTYNFQGKAFISFTGKQVPFGISYLQEDPTYKAVLVTGIVSKYYKKGDRNFIEVLLPKNGYTLTLSTDLGKDTYLISTSTTIKVPRESKEQPLKNTTSSGQIETKREYKNTEVKTLIPEIKKSIGRPIQIEIATSINTQGLNCTDICNQHLTEINRYANENVKLSNLALIKNDVLPIGAVFSIFFSN